MLTTCLACAVAVHTAAVNEEISLRQQNSGKIDTMHFEFQSGWFIFQYECMRILPWLPATLIAGSDRLDSDLV